MTTSETERVATRRGHEARRLRVLHVIITLGETNSQYNEHCLPLVGIRDLSISTYFTPQIDAPPEIDVYPGDGTLRGFFRALSAALAEDLYDVVHVHAPTTGALLLAGFARWSRRGFWRKLVYTVHDSFYDYKLRNKLLMLPVFVGYRRVVFCSRAAYESYPALWKLLARGRSRVIPNGADLERVERVSAGRSRRGDDGLFRVLSVGRLESVKDPLTLLSAFGRAPDDSRLTFVGTGSLAAELSSAIRIAGLEDRVETTGLVPRDEVYRRCVDSDLFVSASHGEGLPVGVIEAMATGCPVVLSDIPPHRELAEGVDFVPFVRPGDSDGLAREIVRFHDMSKDEREPIGRRCRELVHERFGLQAMHAAYDATYREIL